jgi:hypothetical protein
MYHTGLNRALRNAGIPLPYRGKWHEFFESNVEYAEKALDVLVDQLLDPYFPDDTFGGV